MGSFICFSKTLDALIVVHPWVSNSDDCISDMVEICRLKVESQSSGDMELASICENSLKGDSEATRHCERLIVQWRKCGLWRSTK